MVEKLKFQGRNRIGLIIDYLLSQKKAPKTTYG